MKFKTTGLVLALLCLGKLPAQDPSQQLQMQSIDMGKSDPEELKQLSKAFGHFIGRNLENPGFSFDLEMVISGIRDGAAGKPAPMTDQEYEQLLQVYQARAFLALSDENLRKATDFLAGNKLKASVVEIEPSMLQYEVIQPGSGDAVKENSTPLIHYTGKFIDGQTFGSTEQTGEPVALSLDQTIPGFKRGLVGMKEGEKRRLFVHPDLGYGTQGPLPPNSLLIFEIEIVKADTSDDEAMLEEEDDYQLPQW